MRKMKKWLALMVAGMMTVGLMGCSGSSDEGKKKSGSDKADMKAAVVFGLGGLGDQSYNDLAYAVRISDSGKYNNNAEKNEKLNASIDKTLDIIEAKGPISNRF